MLDEFCIICGKLLSLEEELCGTCKDCSNLPENDILGGWGLDFDDDRNIVIGEPDDDFLDL